MMFYTFERIYRFGPRSMGSSSRFGGRSRGYRICRQSLTGAGHTKSPPASSR